MITQELLDSTFAEYMKAMRNEASDVEVKYKTYAAVLELFIRRLERS